MLGKSMSYGHPFGENQYVDSTALLKRDEKK